MTVKISKSALNLREELADLRKPSGIAGEAMLRAETPQEQFSLIGAGRRNIIINGDFQVWQRGTSFTNAGGTYSFTADRWFVNTSNETMNMSRQEFTQAERQIIGSKYYIRTEVSTTGAFAGICQRIEDIYQFDGQTIALSFWARGGQGSIGKVPSAFRFYANGINSGAVQDSTLIDNVEIPLTNEWKYYSYTITVPPITNASYGDISNTSLHIFIQQTANETCDWDLANVQIELGSVATPFEHRSYGEELALCQRYYYKSGGVYQSGYAYAPNNSVDGMRTSWNFPVTMRANPATSISGGSDGGSNASIQIIADSENSATINLRSTDSTYTVWWQGGTITADAEL